ncbi:DUF3868 domain-containing protein [Parabacteroides sp.]
MKHSSIHYIIRYIFWGTGLCLFPSPLAAEGIQIIPRSITVHNDSLHMSLEMDLNAVHVNTITAVSFTPLLQGEKGEVEFPSVVITGSKRYRFERRERALAVGKEPQPVPYLVLLDTRKTGSKTVRYKVSVPYASWMGHATLLLRQEIKDCCDLQLLGVDTLTHDIAVKTAAAPVLASATASSQLPSHPQSVSREKGQVQMEGSIPVKEPAVTIMASAPESYEMTLSIQSPVSRNSEKQHIRSAVLYIDYPLDKDDVYPDYKNNREEINKVDAILSPLLSDVSVRLRRIRVRGYASPDGDYRNNERLAANRSRLFSGYIRDAYGLSDRLFDVSSVAEDWKGTVELLDRMKPAYYREALDVIRRYGIFNGREKRLMELEGGVPYKDMLKNLFPKLRRIEVVVEYDSLEE